MCSQKRDSEFFLQLEELNLNLINTVWFQYFVFYNK